MHRFRDALQVFLAERIKRSRKEHGYSQETMAEKLYISARSYSYLESGTYCCSASTLMFFILILSEDDMIQLRADFRMLVEKEKEYVVA